MFYRRECAPLKGDTLSSNLYRMNIEQIHISKLKRGEMASFEYLYNTWSPKLYNFVMRISHGDTYVSEEIVQSVFVKIWERREELDPERSFASFVCTIAKNQLKNIYQHRMTELLYQEYEVQKGIQSDNTTEKEVEFHLLDEYVTKLVGELPPARREIYILSRQQCLSNREIAQHLGLSEKTVEAQLNKATSFLRTKLLSHYRLCISLLFSMFIG